MRFRNILSLIAALTAAGVPAGCSTTARLTRRQATAHLAQLSRTERQSKVRDDRPQVVRVERDSSDYYLVPVERDGQGEALGTVPIEEVVVVARVRSIPERRGRVTLDFNVELPKELLGRSRSVVITPFLHRQDEQIRSTTSSYAVRCSTACSSATTGSILPTWDASAPTACGPSGLSSGS